MGALKLVRPGKNESALKVVYRSLELCQKWDVRYYPFGMAMEGSWQNYAGNSEGSDFLPPVPSDENDNFKFNGLETEDDLTGWVFHKFRAYDPSIGRFMSADPIADQFAWVSPYNFAENRVPNGVDLWGLQFAGSNGSGSYVLESFRQVFQAVGEKIDKFSVKLFGKSQTTVGSRKTGLGKTKIEVKGTVEHEASATFSTNFGEFLDNSGGSNTPTTSAFSIEIDSKTTYKDTKTVQGTIHGLDVTAKHQMTTDGSSSTESSQVTVGKGNGGAFISKSSDFKNGERTNEKTATGLKAQLSTPTVMRTKLVVGAKAQINLD